MFFKTSSSSKLSGALYELMGIFKIRWDFDMAMKKELKLQFLDGLCNLLKTAAIS